MADVVNLGQFGTPRSSNFSGWAEALSTGIQVGEKIRSNRASEANEAAKNAETIRSNKSTEYMTLINAGMANDNKQREMAETERSNKAEEENKRQTLSAALAKQKFDDLQKNRENTMKAVEQFSMYMNDKSPQDQEIFKQSEHYKELQKLVKAHAPEFINEDDGNIIQLQNKDIYETQIMKTKAQNIQTLASGGQLSPGQQAAQDVLDQVDPRILAAALDVTSKDVNLIGASQEEFGAALNRNLQTIMHGKSALRTANGPQPSPKGNTTQLGASSDPLGLYSSMTPATADTPSFRGIPGVGNRIGKYGL